MRVLQNNTFASVVMPNEQAHRPRKSLPAPREASGAPLQPAEISSQVCIQALYRERLLLCFGYDMAAMLRPHKLLVHRECISAVAISLRQSIHELLHSCPTALFHHTTTYYQMG